MHRPDVQRRRTSSPSGNSNYGRRSNDPKLNAQMRQGRADRATRPSAHRRGRDLDKDDHRPGATSSRGCGTTRSDFTSTNVNGVQSKFNVGAWDLTFSSTQVRIDRADDTARPRRRRRRGRAPRESETMVRYIIRRLLWVIVLLFLVSLLTFVIFYVLPSADPAQLRAGRQPNPQLVEQIRHNLGLDKPWYVQYCDYMKRTRPPLRLRLQLPEQHPVRSQIFDRCRRRSRWRSGRRSSGCRRASPSGSSRRSGAARCSTAPRWAARWSAISAPVYWLGLVCAVPVRRRTSASSDLPRAPAATSR